MNLDWRAYPLPLAEPLRISRSVMARRDAVAVRLTHDGGTGHGEVVTSAYQRLDLGRIDALLTALRPRVTGYADPEALRADLPALAADLADAPGVLGALDAAVHDLVGRRAGMPVWRLVDAPAREAASTAYTIGLVPPADAAATARRLVAAGFTVLKVKAGADDDVARVAAVRTAAPAARLLLDPNGAWTPERTVRVLDAVAACAVDAVEQPVPPGDPDALAWIGARVAVPVVADEDVATVADVHRLAGVVAGINVKLARCGGVAAARRLIDTATGYGMDVMLGCLVASTLGIAPALHLAGHARWVDLDGHLLLADDPWTGIGGADGTLRTPGGPGLGVRPAWADRQAVAR
ncbi:enolase C-terminal domain-like protein [Micromonospora oryzae]|uniref:enolase C-terminal domain-like protein n=1 Tax=Micromonospora sp. DSM 102119 TaxID=3111768 RepID=UPI0031D2E428